MAHADPAGTRKRPTRKTKSTRDEDAFLYDFSLPTVPLSSALDPKLPPDPVESHKSGTPLGAAQARTPQQLRTGDLASPDYLTQRISLVQAEREKLALELELLRLKREQPPPATPPSDQGSIPPPDITFHSHSLFPLKQPRTYQWTRIYRTLAHAQKLLLIVLFVPWLQALIHLLLFVTS